MTTTDSVEPMSLTDFLLARIAEDEAVARTEDNDQPHRMICGAAMLDVGFACDCEYPQRLLAECAAKRRIVAMAAESADFEDAMPIRGYARAIHSPSIDVLVRVQQLLALPYADHPDYDDAWRPDATA